MRLKTTTKITDTELLEMLEPGWNMLEGEPAPRYLDVVVHSGVSGQLLRLLCHRRPGLTAQTHVFEAADNRSLPPRGRTEKSAQRDPPLESHDPAPKPVRRQLPRQQ